MREADQGIKEILKRRLKMPKRKIDSLKEVKLMREGKLQSYTVIPTPKALYRNIQCLFLLAYRPEKR